MAKKQNDFKIKSSGLGKGLAALGLSKESDEKVIELPLEEIRPNPFQPRKTFDTATLTDLANSIQEYGVLQPIVVQKKSNYYELVAGERRWRASLLAGLKKIPALVKTYNDQESTEIALIENLQREDLNVIEEALGYETLMEKFSLTQEEIAKKVSKSRPHVANLLRLLQLPDFIREDLMNGNITMGQARPLVSIKNRTVLMKILKEIKEKSLSARQVEVLLKRINEKKLGNKEKDIIQKDLEDRIKMALGTPINLTYKKIKNNIKGKIEIKFSSEQEFTRILAILENKDEEELVPNDFSV